MTEPVLRLATEADVAALARVHHASQAVAYGGIFPPGSPAPTVADVERAWRLALDGTAAAFAAEAGDEVVGGVVVRAKAGEPGFGHFQKLYVHPDRWGQGLGRRLHDAAVAWLDEAGVTEPSLWVLTENRRARACYERWGWVLDPSPDAVFTHPGLEVTEVRYHLAGSASSRTDENPRRPPST